MCVKGGRSGYRGVREGRAMGHKALRWSLVSLLGGVLLLSGCTTLDYDDYWSPWYPGDPGWVDVYDPGPRLYSVRRSPGLYWRDGYYYRKRGERWERRPHHREPWVVQGHRPPAPVGRFGPDWPRPDPPPVHGRDRGGGSAFGPHYGDRSFRAPRSPWGPGWSGDPQPQRPRGDRAPQRYPRTGFRDGYGVRPPSAGRPPGGPGERGSGGRPAPSPRWESPPPSWGSESGRPLRPPAASHRPRTSEAPVRLEGTLTPGWPGSVENQGARGPGHPVRLDGTLTPGWPNTGP